MVLRHCILDPSAIVHVGRPRRTEGFDEMRERINAQEVVT